MGGGREVTVWDPLVRVLHWALVAAVAAAWLTKEGFGRWHEWIGYASLALVALRIARGWGKSQYARFDQFVRSPAAVLRYATLVLARREPRHLGHNPLGGWMIVALLADVILVGFTGWLYTTQAYWGVEWVVETHEAFAILLLVLVVLHVSGVIAASIRHRENLAAAMIHGRKRAPQPTDVI